MRKTNVDTFLETGKATCKHHGHHDLWMLNMSKQKRKGGKIHTYKALNCKKCNNARTAKYLKRNPTVSDDYRFSFNGTIVRMLAQARSRARKRHLPFEIDAEWIKIKLIDQGYKCAYSGIKFDFSKPEPKDSNRDYLPSPDQIIPGLGYTKNNVALVAVIVNIMKSDTKFNEFVNICKDIAKNNS